MADQRNTIPNADHGPRVVGQSIMEESATQIHRLSDRLVIGDRVFHYGKAGATLSAGKVAQSAQALVTEDTVTVAHGIGTTEVTVTAASVAVNDYESGYLTVDEGTGAGETYKIKSNTATADGVIVCTLYDGLVTAWSISDTDVTITTSPYFESIVLATDGIGLPVGVPLVGVTDTYFAWFQTWGPCGVYIDGTGSALGNAIDERLMVVGATPGSLGVGYAAGYAIAAQVILDSADYADVKYQPVYLTMCP